MQPVKPSAMRGKYGSCLRNSSVLCNQPLKQKLLQSILQRKVNSSYCKAVRYFPYNNSNSQIDTTITNFIDNYNQLNMFRAIVSPILRNNGLCLQLMVQCTGDAAITQHRRCIVPQSKFS